MANKHRFHPTFWPNCKMVGRKWCKLFAYSSYFLHIRPYFLHIRPYSLHIRPYFLHISPQTTIRQTIGNNKHATAKDDKRLGTATVLSLYSIMYLSGYPCDSPDTTP